MIQFSAILYQVSINSSRVFQKPIDKFWTEAYNKNMEKEMKKRLLAAIEGFHLPRYRDLPAIGLYLDQTVQYINSLLSPLGCLELTGSMVSNYVKKGYVLPPVKKRYDADRIAALIFVAIAKTVLSMDHIDKLLELQKQSYSIPVAYDYMCSEMENVLFYQFELKDTLDSVGTTHSVEKNLFRSVIIAVAQIIYLHLWLNAMDDTVQE